VTNVVSTAAGLRERLRGIKLFMLDLDGTTYVEDRLVPGALEFLAGVTSSGRAFTFLTNNTSRSAADYVRKLTTLGIPAAGDNVFTAGQATALFLSSHYPRSKVFLVGTQSLSREFAGCGIDLAGREERADVVVVGFDTELAYWKLERACGLIDDGAVFMATHPDLVCPVVNRRYIPDCGSMCQMITNATGKRPSMVFGKPDPSIVEMLRLRMGFDASEIVMVGDRLYTDIALAINAGVAGICVLTGETTRETLRDSPHQPDFVVESIADITELL
jgi:4-nitrophenyl phosphatase/NagD protein